jgi:heterodisulfide reductase subunit A-like polyferredoxin
LEVVVPTPEVLATQVGIVGGGPVGLMLSHLLAKSGIDSMVVEKRDYDTIRTTHRAGILEHGSVSMLVDSGVSDRVLTAGYKHEALICGSAGRFTGSISPIWSVRPSGCTHRMRCLSTSLPPGNGPAARCTTRPDPKDRLDSYSDIALQRIWKAQNSRTG